MSTIHVLHAGLKVNDKTAIVVPGIFIMHAFLYVDINTADSVDNPLKR